MHKFNLTAANYYDVTESTNTASASNRFNEVLTYNDHRGNIKTLQRQVDIAGPHQPLSTH